MKNFSLLIKPASWDCNLRCQYCFYLKKNEIFGSKSIHMSEKVLDRVISSFMGLSLPQYAFGWQGGEPTIMGLDFFKKVIEFQIKYGKSGKTVSNGLQTNGTLLDDDWCRHLAKYNFLVGVSLDGPEKIHNQYRHIIGGGGSHKLVLQGINALKRHNVEFNILTLVSKSNVKHPLDIYDYIKNMGVSFHQYIECVEFDAKGELKPYAIHPEEWGNFLCTIFDEWYKYDTKRISVRLFDSILVKLVNNYTNICAMGTDCKQYFVVEHNGDIYPCDFFVSAEAKLGNIMESQWSDFLRSKLYSEFGAKKHKWNVKCNTCEYLSICAGCCTKNRFDSWSNPSNLSILCKAWKQFYAHTLERFKILAEEIKVSRKREQLVPQAHIQKTSKISRNSSCPCGSAKKYKRCCGREG